MFNEIDKCIYRIKIISALENQRNEVFITPHVESILMKQSVYTMKAGRIGLKKMFEDCLTDCTIFVVFECICCFQTYLILSFFRPRMRIQIIYHLLT